MENNLLEAALSARRAGVSTVPVELPGKRPPPGLKWKPRQTQIPDEATTRADFAGKNGSSGLAAIAGAVSGNLEVIDSDLAGAFSQDFENLVEAERPGLFDKLTRQKTLNAGDHFIFRCPGATIGRSEKLAHKKIEVNGTGEHEHGGKRYTARQHGGKWFIFPCALETRGEGGYFVVTPSPGYEVTQTPPGGEFFNFPEITPAERETLLRLARALDELPPESVEDGPQQKPVNVAGLRPGEDFSRRGEVLSFLLKAGWKRAGGNPERLHLTRPGKERGISATLYNGRILRVFSSNAGPFEENTNYSAFAVYAKLEHGGDFQAAARELGRQGFGSPPQSKTEDHRGDQYQGPDKDQDPRPEEPENKTPRFEFTHNADILTDLRPTEWRIRDVMVDNSLYYNFGDPGHFKTFAELDRDLCIASGISYHGHDVKQGTVFYIAGEGQQGIGRRIAAFHIAHKTRAADVPFFVSRTPTQIMAPAALDDVRRAVDVMAKAYGPPAVVHFDTLARNFGEGDENATKDMNAAISNLDKAFGNDFCRGLTHHTGHGNKDRARGSIALHGAADIAYRVSLTESGQVLVECKKMKDAPNAPLMLFNRREILLQIGDEVDGSYVLDLASEGDEALHLVNPKKAVELKGNLLKALDILRNLYKRYNENLKKSRITGTPNVLYTDWRTACNDAGLYPRTDHFRKAFEKLLLRGFVGVDESKRFVYLKDIIEENGD